ncbi:BnaA05g16390D [Brassica napus]|uniref:BnaA05g16390D protein n=1 Tax=Brassica napus TaxID=3708 RepID=A0A078HCP0_BRANA|nr:BnaA05g16390D [Brassica napus]
MSTSLTNLSTATDSNESSPLLATARSFKEWLPLNQTYLHDDLLLNFFVRVSVLYYPILSLVSKRFRCLLASRALYEIRKLLNRTESCIYVCLQYGIEESCWFTLCRRPTRSKSGDNLLISVTTSNFSPCGNFLWNLSTVGSNIYMIGGYIGYKPTSRVFCMDCRSHIWQEAPSMLIARTVPRVSVLDGKIYVLESFKKFDSSNLMEIFDPKTQTWEHVPTPGAEIHGEYMNSTGNHQRKPLFFWRQEHGVQA